jgi:hypothetical protein
LLYGVASYEEILLQMLGMLLIAYVPGEPDSIVVSPLNVQIFTETNEVDGCSEVNSYNIVLLGYTVKEAVTIPLTLRVLQQKVTIIHIY